MTEPLHVLHVVEAWGGGVAAAVLDYVRSTPQHRHSLLSRSRTAHDPHEDVETAFVHRLPMPRGHRAARAAVAEAYAALRPDVVHAHSSLAGVYARAGRAVPRHRVVYTPHCYAFERLDVPAPVRAGFRAVERALAGRTAAVVAVGPREAELARSLGGASIVAHVPNVVRVPAATPPHPRGRPFVAPPFVVGAVGRLSPQKDPDWFADVVREVHRLDPDAGIRWEWLGGEPSDIERRLHAVGIHVSGWLPREAVLRRMQRLDVYVHSAAWEGAPLTVLEAAAYRLPIVARDIPALRSLGVPGLVADPAAAARQVLLLRDTATSSFARRRSAALDAEHQPQAQARALADVYAQVSAAGAGAARTAQVA